MIGRIFLSLALFEVIVVTICHGTELNSNEDEARLFLNQTSDNLFKLYDETADHAFNDYDYTYDQDVAHKKFRIFKKKMFEDSRKFDFKNFKDKELTYAFEMLTKIADTQIIGEKSSLELLDSLKELENLQQTNIFYDFEKMFEESNDAMVLEYDWSAWRRLTGKWARDNLEIMLKALKQAASLNEKSPLEFWMRGFNISEMENLMNDIQPLYLELHAFVRNLLRKKYGESIIAPDGLIPDHLFRQITYQMYTNDSIIEEMFPHESLPQPDMDKFTSTELFKIIEQLFENLGFEKYPSSVWGDSIKLKSNESRDDDGYYYDNYDDYDNNHDDECEMRIWYFSPNTHLEYCKNMNYWDFLDAYSYMSHIHYAKEMKGLPVYYFSYPNNLEIGVGKAVVLSASTYHNAKTIGLLPDYNSTQEVEMNRLLRMAIRQLMVIYIPMDFVHAKVMADLLSGNVTKAELNKHYWQLMEKYAGVGPPKGYSTRTYDLPNNFYLEMNDNYMSSDVIMEFLSYQIYKKLCELSGHYPKEPLHLCDINGSKDAGNALKKMMKLGASKPFSEVLASMFPEDPVVRADGLLEYYSPIKKLVAEKNKEANVIPGWKSSV